jgi:hypothetical protein
MKPSAESAVLHIGSMTPSTTTGIGLLLSLMDFGLSADTPGEHEARRSIISGKRTVKFDDSMCHLNEFRTGV